MEGSGWYFIAPTLQDDWEAIYDQQTSFLNHKKDVSLGQSWSDTDLLQDAESISTHNPSCESSKAPEIMGFGSKTAESAPIVHKNYLFREARK